MKCSRKLKYSYFSYISQTFTVPTNKLWQLVHILVSLISSFEGIRTHKKCQLLLGKIRIDIVQMEWRIQSTQKMICYPRLTPPTLHIPLLNAVEPLSLYILLSPSNCLCRYHGISPPLQFLAADHTSFSSIEQHLASRLVLCVKTGEREMERRSSKQFKHPSALPIESPSSLRRLSLLYGFLSGFLTLKIGWSYSLEEMGMGFEILVMVVDLCKHIQATQKW